MMIRVLIVEECKERRDELVDALCELPGVEVRATAHGVASALAVLDQTKIDAVIATGELPGSSIATLIDDACRRGLDDILVLAREPLLPGISQYWRDLGARDVVCTVEALVARVSTLAGDRARRQASRRRVALQLELAVALERRAHAPTTTTSGVHREVVGGMQLARLPQDVALGELLHKALRYAGGVVPPEVQVHLEVGLDLPRVRCVPRDIEQMMLLMLRDASAAIPLGGKVWLIAEREGLRNVRIEVLESSGQVRQPGGELDVVRTIANRYGGELRVVQLGGSSTSLQVVLPALVGVTN